MNVRALVLLGGAQLAIGAAAIFARLALTGAGPLAVSALRLGIATLPVVGLACARHAYARIDPRTERRLALAGGMLALHFATWIASLAHASVAVSTLLVCSTPVFTEIWAVLRSRRVRPAVLASIVLAAAGVALVAGVPGGAQTPLGIGLALAGAVAMAAYLLLVRASDPRYTTLAVIARTYPVAAAILAVGAVVLHDHFPAATATAAWAGIVAMALVSQLFGHTALNAAVRAFSATFVATTTLLEPVIAGSIAAIVFGERLERTTIAGACAILVAIALAIRSEPGPPEVMP